MLTGNILITGGSGSLGTAILKRAHEEGWDANFTVVARSEAKMDVIRRTFPDVGCVIGDVRDADWMAAVAHGHDTIIHAAAIKVVPVAEANPRETILTNVMGSINVARAAISGSVRRVVGISTDKACGPTYYGITKRLMEGIFRQMSVGTDTEFVLCRYGNVLGSSGSVVPFFRKQVEDNKPFTITDKRMTRFWLTMDDALNLIELTYNVAPSGTIVVPKAPASNICNLAAAIDPDREQLEIGIRPGERLHETLIVQEESMHTRDMGEYFIIYPPDSQVHSNLPDQYEYRSDDRNIQLTVRELRTMLP